MDDIKLRRTLLELEKCSGVALAIDAKRGELQIRGRSLHEVDTGFSPDELMEESGQILTGRFTGAMREAFQNRGISYFEIDERELFLAERGVSILIRPTKESFRVREGAKRHGRGLTPTDIISPMGLPIADLLLKISEEDLRSSYRSANQFAKEFGLYQPKLSRMMSAAGARDLSEMADRIRELSLDWWDVSLGFTSIRRRLHPFFVTAKPYHLSNFDLFGDLRKQFQLNSREENEILPGPLSVAVSSGHFMEDVVDFWVSKKAAVSLKKKWRLLPGFDRNFPTVWLAEIDRPFQKEGLLTPLVQRSRGSLGENRVPGRLNLLRVVWDLYQGESRQRAAGREILKDLLR